MHSGCLERRQIRLLALSDTRVIASHPDSGTSAHNADFAPDSPGASDHKQGPTRAVTIFIVILVVNFSLFDSLAFNRVLASPARCI